MLCVFFIIVALIHGIIYNDSIAFVAYKPASRANFKMEKKNKKTALFHMCDLTRIGSPSRLKTLKKKQNSIL